jgi:hypothetical protein
LLQQQNSGGGLSGCAPSNALIPVTKQNPDWMSSLLRQHRLMSPVGRGLAHSHSFELTSWLHDFSLLAGLRYPPFSTFVCLAVIQASRRVTVE